jgi:hypothetical protein
LKVAHDSGRQKGANRCGLADLDLIHSDDPL